MLRFSESRWDGSYYLRNLTIVIVNKLNVCSSMSHEHTSLDAAATERKARLAKLASLKRKRPGTESSEQGVDASIGTHEAADLAEKNKFISGRNYDLVTKGPKLGFEQAPDSLHETVEERAQRISAAAAEQAAKDEEEAQKGIDLFKLQPKKPNWDLKRDLAERMKVVDVRTQNAIAKLVRERIQKAKEEAQRQTPSNQTVEGEELGVEGSTLVEAVHLREKEEEEDRRKEAAEEEGIP